MSYTKKRIRHLLNIASLIGEVNFLDLGVTLDQVPINGQDISGAIAQGDVSGSIEDVGRGLGPIDPLRQLDHQARVVQLAVLDDVGVRVHRWASSDSLKRPRFRPQSLAPITNVKIFVYFLFRIWDCFGRALKIFSTGFRSTRLALLEKLQ